MIKQWLVLCVVAAAVLNLSHGNNVMILRVRDLGMWESSRQNLGNEFYWDKRNGGGKRERKGERWGKREREAETYLLLQKNSRKRVRMDRAYLLKRPFAPVYRLRRDVAALGPLVMQGSSWVHPSRWQGPTYAWILTGTTLCINWKLLASAA